MPRPRTKAIRWLIKTIPELQIKDGTYIPLREWINTEMRAWQDEIDIHKKRSRFRNTKLKRKAGIVPVHNNAPKPKPESADLTL